MKTTHSPCYRIIKICLICPALSGKNFFSELYASCWKFCFLFLFLFFTSFVIKVAILLIALHKSMLVMFVIALNFEGYRINVHVKCGESLKMWQHLPKIATICS